MARVNSYMDVAQYSNPNVSIMNPTGKVKPIGAVKTPSVGDEYDTPVVPQDGVTKFLGGIGAYLGANDSLPKPATAGVAAPAIIQPMPVRTPAQVTASTNATTGRQAAVAAKAPAIGAPAANSFPTLKSIGGVDPNGPEVMTNLINQRNGVYVPQKTTFANDATSSSAPAAIGSINPLASGADTRTRLSKSITGNVPAIAANPGGKTLFTDTGGYMEGGTARESGNKAAENIATTGNIHGTVDVPILNGQGRSVGSRSEVASPINAPAIFKNKQEIAKDATDRRGQDLDKQSRDIAAIAAIGGRQPAATTVRPEAAKDTSKLMLDQTGRYISAGYSPEGANYSAQKDLLVASGKPVEELPIEHTANWTPGAENYSKGQYKIIITDANRADYGQWRKRWDELNKFYEGKRSDPRYVEEQAEALRLLQRIGGIDAEHLKPKAKADITPTV